MSDIPWAALAPVFVLLVAFVIFCLVDIRRSTVRYVPRWVWVLLCVLSIPLGGIIYLLFGREHGEPPPS